MMSELGGLKQIINSSLISVCSGGRVVLEEKAPQATLRKVIVDGVPVGSIAIRLDTLKMDAIVVRGVNQRCDYVIMGRLRQKKYAVFVELKSRDYPTKELKYKCIGSACLMDYISAVLERFGKQKIADYERRYAVLYRVNVVKTPTRPLALPTKDTPSSTLHYPVSGEVIYFKRLICQEQ